MAPKDMYAVLGVKKDASPQEIKKVYRKIARETHPDVKPGDAKAEQRFKEATAAFEVLSDEKKRKLYDEFGEDALRMGFDPEKSRAYRSWQARPGGEQSGLGGFEQVFGGFGGRGAEGFDINDILGDILGGGRRRGSAGRGFGGGPVARRGADTQASMTITLREAVLGGTREITVDRPRTCRSCKGAGLVGHAPCNACGASGTVTEKKRVDVRVAPGAAEGQRIRLAGLGSAGMGGGPSGDLLVKIKLAPHPVLRAVGQDLHMDLPVSLKEALFGAAVEVPTFQGEVTVKIPAGSQSGKKLRLKGRGIPKPKGTAGDLYLSLSVRLPKTTDEEEVREAVETLERRYGESPRASIRL